MRNVSSGPVAVTSREASATRTTRFRRIGVAVGLLAVLGSTGPASPQFRPTHLDGTRLPLGCQSCHVGGHGARNTALLRARDPDVCLRCHDVKATERNLNVTPRTDIRGALGKPSRHPFVETAGIHRKGEDIPSQYAATRRHVACGDCHDVHWSRPGKTLDRVDGVNSFGTRVPEATVEYEVCYKCHADSPGLPRGARNTRVEFSQSNPSFHPVESKGKAARVPSLVPPMNAGSIISCSACHGNDDPLGPKGTHGSIYAPILVLKYETRDGLQENNFQYALCYKCHDRNNLLRDQSFPLHNLHVVKVRASCRACHTAHGSQINTHLISFNPDVAGPQRPSAPAAPLPLPGLPQRPQGPATPRQPIPALPPVWQAPSGRTFELGRYVDLGNGHGQCFLNCHGKDHNPASY